MSKLKIYLSGAIRKVDENFQNWRDKCNQIKYDGFYINLKFIDPNSYFNYTDKLPKNDKQCIDLFMWQVENSDVLLVNLDYSENSIGTCMEIEHAYCNNIPVVTFGNKPDTWYPWAKERSSVIFDELEEALEYINASYCKTLN